VAKGVKMKLEKWNSRKLFSIIKSGFFLVFIILLSKGCSPDNSINPEWAKDLVIYEIATKGFTSTNGPESGTFQSLKEKMAYLEDLGINAIWLTGHSLSDPNHFYGIWTQYACIEPDKLDPSLGTEQDFKDMIEEAHRRSILIFLDTIEHGVMNNSPLIKEHPDWFKDGSWGMTDYDWEGDHPDLENWWVEMWTKAVLEWGVDGFRCDCGLHRPDLWQEIKRRCAAAGKPIFILGESGIENISDACQRDIMLFNQVKGRLDNHSVLRNLPSVEDLFHKPLDWSTMNIQCEIQYEDGSVLTDSKHGGELQVNYTGLGEDVIGTWESEPDGMKDWTWLIEGADLSRKIKNINVECPERNWQWQSDGWGWKLGVEYDNNRVKISGGNPLPGSKLRVISPSCHDCGWDGFPKDKNPYTTQGSRHIMGYGVLFAPAIPIIMSGDEFDAEYKALPNHTPDLYGKGEAGTGRWLYGSWLQWDQLNEKRHSDMHKDVKRMLAIRREHRDLIHAIKPGETDIKIKAVPVLSEDNLPVPYILSNGKRALLVVGNPTNKDVKIKLNISNEILGFPQQMNEMKTTILWPENQKSANLSDQELSQYSCTVPADYNRGGGLHITRFEPL
jgi:Alpha amylase, catalytic domain